MALTLGEKLRQAREERGISISEVAEQTRISPLYLKSIEKDDYKPLPGGIFNKGFVRSYARYIGFDEEEALADYAQLMAETEATDETEHRAYRPEVLTDDRAARSMAPSIILAAIVLLLIIGGIALLIGYFANRPTTIASNSAATNTNLDVNVNRDANVPITTSSSSAPTTGLAKIEFSTTGEDISLSSVTDGRQADQLVTLSKPATFEPRESLHLRYAKSRAAGARLTINGKQISLPQTPANPKREPIEFDITKDNVQQIWQAGEIRFAPVAQPVPTMSTPRPTPRPATNTNAAPVTRPSLPPINSATPKRPPTQ